MKDILNLLTQVSIITKKNAEFLDATGGRFNMFRITGVNHYENTHSSILAELLNPKGSHGLKGKFLKVFVDQLMTQEKMKTFHCENATVKTEAPGNGRIDILIVDDLKRAIIIENKIYANDQWEQLKRYDDHAKKTYGSGNYVIFYLTLQGKEASKNSGENVVYFPLSFAYDIIQWLEQCVNLSARYPLVRETMNQYINHLKQLTNQDMDKINQNELVEILSKPENVLSAIKISENMKNLKIKLVTDMARKVAEKFYVEFEVDKEANGFYFYKNGWKKGAGIWFAETNGATYYAIKTTEACNGKAVRQEKIIELFELDPVQWDPYGYGIVKKDHWKNNSELYVEIADGTFAKEIIIPNLKKALDYLISHSKIENEL